jgi:hypothetical protein
MEGRVENSNLLITWLVPLVMSSHPEVLWGPCKGHVISLNSGKLEKGSQ